MARKAGRKGGRIRSQAQRRKFAELLVDGKIDAEVYERWNRKAGGKKLPEHVRKKKRKKPPAKRRRAAKHHR
jgi:hypothetical protein